MRVGLAISTYIALELGTPPGGIRCGPSSVLGATVPVAAVHEHSHTDPRKRDVDRPPGQARNLDMDAEPEPTAMEKTTYRQLRAGVGSALASHPRRYAG